MRQVKGDEGLEQLETRTSIRYLHGEAHIA